MLSKLVSLLAFGHDTNGSASITTMMIRGQQQATQPCWTITISATTATINEYRTYLFILCLLQLIYCFSYNYSLTRVCFLQRSFIINNNVDTSSIKIIDNTSKQLQAECEPTMAMAMVNVTRRQQQSNHESWTSNSPLASLSP